MLLVIMHPITLNEIFRLNVYGQSKHMIAINSYVMILKHQWYRVFS